MYVATLSAGTCGLGNPLSAGAEVTFGFAPTEWTAGFGNRGYQLSVFWPTDPTLVPPDVSWGFAVGDGHTDDSYAINNALALAQDAPSGGLVMLPAGTFLCGNTVVVGGDGVHLWGAGQDATQIWQGFTPGPGSNPAVIEITGKNNSIRNLTVSGNGKGSTGATPGPVATPISTDDPGLAYGWGILCAGVTDTHIQDIRVTECYHGIGAFGFQNVRLFEIEVDGVLGTYGYYTQGGQGAFSSATITVGGSPASGNVITVDLTDDLGNLIVVTYTLVSGDSSLPTLAGHLASAINASNAVVGQLAFLDTVTSSGDTLNLTALYAGTQVYTCSASATGGTEVSASGFAGGSGGASDDFVAIRCGCKPATGNYGVEAFHCDAGVSSFTTVLAGAAKYCAYHTRLTISNAGTSSGVVPTFVDIQAASSDHSHVSAFSFESGRGIRLLNSRSGASDGRAVYVGPGCGSDVRIIGCDFGNGAAPGIEIAANNVLVEGTTVANSGTGIQLDDHVSYVALIGNVLGAGGSSGQTTAIDAAALTPDSDFITIVGNTLITGALLRPVTSIGQHSRIADNPGYNPVSNAATLTPLFPTSGLHVQNPFCCDAMVVIIPNSRMLSNIKVTAPGGSDVIYLPGSYSGSTPLQVFVACGASISMTIGGSGTASTWTWFPT